MERRYGKILFKLKEVESRPSEEPSLLEAADSTS